MARCLLLLWTCLLALPVAAWAGPLAPVLPGYAIQFPKDEGSHPAFGTEWWYVTGWLSDAAGRPYGFQVTFFRHREPASENNPSRFAPKQILFAHAAVSDPQLGYLLHDQRVARAGFGLAEAQTNAMAVWIKDWRLQRRGHGYWTQIHGQDFSLQLEMTPTQPALVNGNKGYSQKGPNPEQASYYYSQPQLKVSGNISRKGRPVAVTGTAWLDHEWSSAYMASQAVGWDWTGINLNDGGALMAFRMRDAAGKTLWAGGTYRDAHGHMQVYPPAAIRFTPLADWTSPRTGIHYPVAMQVGAGNMTVRLRPLMQDQENDARESVGSIYWEGAVTAYAGPQPTGRGYLELTGYGQRLRLQ